MPQPARLDLVHKAICAGILGHIQWKDSAAKLVRDSHELEGLTPEGIRGLLRQFVLDGHELTARQETREEFLAQNPDDPFWYRAIIPRPGFARGLFVEVVLVDDDTEEPWVEVVNCHRQHS
jgi:hypothetical protein